MAGSEPVMCAPAEMPRRSFHYRDLLAAGATFRKVADAGVAASYGRSLEDEVALARRLGLVDLSPLPRTGFKGPGMADWLASQGLRLGEDSNRAYRCGEASLAARIAPGEVAVLGGFDGSDGLCERLEAAWSYESGMVWPVPRRDNSFWFLVTGRQAPAMFAKICGVDLRPKSFGDLSIAQTSVARTNCIVVRDDQADVLAYHLLGDSASASYSWGCLLDAMAEFEGGPVGLDALLALREGRPAEESR